jgi:hypothetical protein
MSDPIPRPKPKVLLRAPPTPPPETVAETRLENVLPDADAGFRVAARDALPKFTGCAVPLLNPPILEIPGLRAGVVLVVLAGIDWTLGRPGNL